MARARRGPFRPSDGDAARRFVASVVSGAGSVPISRRTVDPSRWSDAYAARIANRLRADAEAGVPLSLQRARRGPELVQARRGREGHGKLHFYGPSGLVGRPFRSVAAGLRWMRNRPEFPNGSFQVTAVGTLLDTYGAAGYTMGADSWRTLVTGFGGELHSGSIDGGASTFRTADLTADDLRRVASAAFSHVDTWEFRAGA